MGTHGISSNDLKSVLTHLSERGYAVIEGVLSEDEIRHYRGLVEELFERERGQPFEPEDGPALPEDAEMEAYLKDSYQISDAERERLMRRIRHSRAQNEGTPWPVPPSGVVKNFLHLPTLFDYDQSQRIWNLVNKAPDFGKLVEHPVVLSLARGILGDDCVLADCSATSIGPHTDEGGAWHVDVPLGQLPEPLPDFPLTIQNAWMLDAFTTTNGATQIVPDSHRTRRKPVWGEQQEEGKMLTGSPGSVAIWLSNTWHRSGPNTTDDPRRAILCYYSRSWIKPFTDYTSIVPGDCTNLFTRTAISSGIFGERTCARIGRIFYHAKMGRLYLS